MVNFPPFSCSFRSFFSNPNNNKDQQPNDLRSQDSFTSSFNSSFSSRSSLPRSLSTAIIPPPPLTTLHHECVFTIKQQPSSHILSLILAGKHLLSGSSGPQIHRWPRHHAVATGGDRELKAIQCRSAVKCLRILNDDTVITAHQDHKVRIWKIKKMDIKIVATLPTLKDRLTKALYAKNYVTIRRHKKLTWIHHNDVVSSLAVSADKSLIYSASWDRSFRVWRSSDFKCLELVSNAHDDAINAIVLSDDGFVYTGSADKKIKAWRFNPIERKHELITSLTHHRSAVNALAYDEDSSVLISGACSGVMIASERSFLGGHMVVVGALLGHKKAILCVRVEGGLVCSGSGDKTVRLWRRSVGKSYLCLGVLEGHGGPVKCLDLAVERYDDGDGDEREYMVYSGCLDGDIKAWKVWVPFAIRKSLV